MTGISECSPKTRSLRNIAVNGTKKARRRSANCAPLNSASAATGLKLGGCGIKREAPAARIMPARNRKRGWFILDNFILQHRQQIAKPEPFRATGSGRTDAGRSGGGRRRCLE